MELGSLKHVIVYVGIAANTDLRRVIFPAEERKREDQLRALCLMRSTIRLKRSFFLHPNNSGRPSMFLSVEQLWGSDRQKNMVSSANSRYGDKGSPCLIPRCGLTEPLAWPLRRVSCVIKTLSEMALCGTKADWLSEMQDS